MGHAVAGNLARLQSAPRDFACWQKAQNLLMSCRYGEALAGYRPLIQTYPEAAQLWFELGIAEGGDLNFEAADQAFQTCITLAPNDAAQLVLISEQYQRLRRLDRVRDCLERACAADPSSVHARLMLAACLERERHVTEASQCVENCLAQFPQDSRAIYYRAFLLHRQGKNSDAETILRDLIQTGPRDPSIRQSSRHLLGVVLDELGQYDEALRWLEEAKAQLRQTNNAVALEKIYERASRQRRELSNELTTAEILRWRAEEPIDASGQQIAFLGGHPRSGTTLIEQILGANSNVMAFDEPEAFTQEILNQVAPPISQRGVTLDGLKSLSKGAREHLRARYLKSLFREVNGQPDAKVLLDKNPSPTSSLPLWLRIFPNLKVIIPLRDPRDIVVSCYFQNLALTSANVNFLTLAGVVRHYTDLMNVWLRMRELGGFDWMETQYTDMVSKPEIEGRRVTEFLGVPWQTQQSKYYESARKKFIFAPTYHDVTKPTHQRSVGRWAHYAQALEPFKEQLRPYCLAFGYR